MCRGEPNPIGNLSNINQVGYINSNLVNETKSDQFPDLSITKQLYTLNDTVHLHLMLNATRYNELTEWFIKGKNMFNPLLILHPTLLHPFSRGNLSLASTNIDDPPLIYPNFLDSNTTDLVVLMAGVNHVLNMLNTNSTGFGDFELLDITSPNCLPYDFKTEAYWNCTMKALARPTGQPVGTCRMGTDPMNNDVVNERLKVFGMNNLRVVDGSVIPTITAGDGTTTNVMMAEKAAYYILYDTYFG
ncbi:glucose dehydrogenase [FAD, quinone]-like [Atheta coriaria]|uniref:glucose dehydrogenase [FAD, quinone]-like n=1 Tax=Dalotia coriaria TaxID=877792 RepID=UPI0031F3FE8A